jgi:VWFA-related protein
MGEMNQLNAGSARDQEARASVYSLLGIVNDLRKVPGRKTVLYFSEGLQLPNSVWHVFTSIIRTANRGNVSIYSVDARGLRSTSDTAAATGMMASAGANVGPLYSGSVAAVTRGEAVAADAGLDALRANTQLAMKELADSTGGFLTANTNDLRVPLRRALQEMANYYEITYRSSNQRYDGQYRKIEVRVRRPGLGVRARDGYFAFPPDQEQALLPYELPLLKAISERPQPRGVGYRATAYRFHPGEEGVKLALVVQTPLESADIQAGGQRQALPNSPVRDHHPQGRRW